MVLDDGVNENFPYLLLSNRVANYTFSIDRTYVGLGL